MIKNTQNTYFGGHSSMQSGQAMIIAVLFFLSIALIIVIGVSTPILEEMKIANTLLNSKQTYFLSEAGVEDVTYRLINGVPVSSTETLSLNNATATTTIITTGGGKTVISIGDVHDSIRKTEVALVTGVGIAFNYGIEAGQGGFSLSGSSGINGSVHANGDILGTGSSYITGSAIAANGPALSSDQSNTTPATPTNSIAFGNTNATQDIAQSFQISAPNVLNKVQLYIKKTGNPASPTVRVFTDQSGVPSSTELDSGTLNASLVTTSYGWVDVIFTEGESLSSGTTYWLVIDSVTNSTNYFTIGANVNGYGGGVTKTGKAGSWVATSPSTLDTYFNLYLGGETALIGGESYSGALRIGTGGTGNAWGHTVTGTTVAGTLYCQSGSNNNKSCNTTRADPTAEGYPLSDGNIQDWKDEAAAGGVYSGNYSVSGISSAALGPKKVTGNLTVGNSGILTVEGTLWVQGNLTVSGASQLKLSSAYGAGSGVIIVDGYISIGGSGIVTGSGTPGSYILLVTTSDCPTSSSCSGNDAIEVSGAAGSVILNAQKGTLYLSGSAQTKEATAYRIVMDGSTTVNYESGLADINFSSGPSGGYSISGWKETQ